MENKMGSNHGSKSACGTPCAGSSSAPGKIGVAEGMRYISLQRQWDEESWNLLLLSGRRENRK